VVTELLGRWTVDRRVQDLRGGTNGRFRGIATFAPDGAWIEEGTLEFGGYRGPARRELRIVDGTVEFADGRPFHPLDLSGAPVEHLCGEDTYAGQYRFLSPDRLRVSWRVTGPEKDQRIDTLYSRCYSD
jgi:hypothetical protein